MSFTTSDITIKIVAANQKYSAVVDGDKDDDGKWTVNGILSIGKNEVIVLFENLM